ncbi:ATP-binding cassette domain-containing protein [bacterium]|nr:ATP-binding cassette domain-containing protein [bacterium]
MGCKRISERTGRRPERATPAARVPPPPSSPNDLPAPVVLPAQEGLAALARASHLLVIGDTGSGKTTLIRALLTTLPPGEVLVLDPKAWPDKWGQIAAIGLDGEAEYSQIEAALQAVLTEVRQRLAVLNQGQHHFPRLTVVVDALNDVADVCATMSKVFARVDSIGRELNISLITIAQRPTVKARKIDGDGDSRQNYTQVLLGKYAAKAVPATAGARVAVLAAADGVTVVDTGPLERLMQHPIALRPWTWSHATFGDGCGCTADGRAFARSGVAGGGARAECGRSGRTAVRDTHGTKKPAGRHAPRRGAGRAEQRCSGRTGSVSGCCQRIGWVPGGEGGTVGCQPEARLRRRSSRNTLGIIRRVVQLDECGNVAWNVPGQAFHERRSRAFPSPGTR